ALGTPHVHFVGHVSDEELVAFYEIADLFLCASEHEGFCVPLVEAFYKQVPVLAYAATAVPSTMDGAGVLFEDRDPLHVARLMDAVVSDVALQDQIVAGQLAAVDRLRSKDFAGALLGFVDPAARGGDLTIFHYALPSPMTEAFASLPSGRVLQYHNVTPAAYFAPYDPALFRLATLGRRELATLAGRVDLALGDSEYNR